MDICIPFTHGDTWMDVNEELIRTDEVDKSRVTQLLRDFYHGSIPILFADSPIGAAYHLAMEVMKIHSLWKRATDQSVVRVGTTGYDNVLDYKPYTKNLSLSDIYQEIFSTVSATRVAYKTKAGYGGSAMSLRDITIAGGRGVVALNDIERALDAQKYLSVWGEPLYSNMFDKMTRLYGRRTETVKIQSYSSDEATKGFHYVFQNWFDFLAKYFDYSARWNTARMTVILEYITRGYSKENLDRSKKMWWAGDQKNPLTSEIGAEMSAILNELACATFDFRLYSRLAVIINFPKEIRLREGRLHCGWGPAIDWRDGTGTWAMSGLTVHPFKRLTPTKIFAETNLEARRAMMETMGVPELMHQLSATVLDIAENGTLYRYVEPGTGNQRRCVLVKNSTPNPDGSRRQFLLELGPGSRAGTVHEAIAATFGMQPADYHPMFET